MFSWLNHVLYEPLLVLLIVAYSVISVYFDVSLDTSRGRFFRPCMQQNMVKTVYPSQIMLEIWVWVLFRSLVPYSIRLHRYE